MLEKISQISWKISLKSFIWAIGTVFFGLLQLWLLLGESLFVKTKVFPLEELIKSGVLLFFATAVIASITIDYLLSRKINRYTLSEMFFFMGFPLIMIGFCVWLFSISYDENIEFELIYSTEQIILIMTLIYSIFVKYNAFLEELEENK